ncbi:MAG: hypothetical protein M3430_20200 [Acidobacteriota bacterium]|nr:hypothetical protein [Acidobacteriota bacterium]
MKSNFNLWRSASSSITLLLFLTTLTFPQSASPNQPLAIIEMVSSWCHAYCESITTRVFADGRRVTEAQTFERTKSGHLRKVFSKVEKRLEPGEIAELVGLADHPGFFNSQPEYIVTTVPDYPVRFTITYQNNGREKRVTVINYGRGSKSEKDKVPSSVLKLMEWAKPYSFQ